MTDTNPVRAFVPADPARDDAMSIAAAWVEQFGQRPLVVVNLIKLARSIPTWLDCEYALSPDLTDQPIIVHCPGAEALTRATTRGRLAPIVVVETPSFRSRGWAIETEAINLDTGEPEVDDRSDLFRDAIEHMSFIGSSGWGIGMEKKVGLAELQRIAEAGEFDWDLIASSLIGRGHIADHIKRLGKFAPARRLVEASQRDRWNRRPR